MPRLVPLVLDKRRPGRSVWAFRAMRDRPLLPSMGAAARDDDDIHLTGLRCREIKGGGGGAGDGGEDNEAGWTEKDSRRPSNTQV